MSTYHIYLLTLHVVGYQELLNIVLNFLQINAKSMLHFSNKKMRRLSKLDTPTYLVSYQVRNKNKQDLLVYIPTYIHVKLVLYLFKVLHYKFPEIIFIILGAFNKATHHHKGNIKQYWFPSFVSSLVDLPNFMKISKGHFSFSTQTETKHEEHWTW